MLNILQCIVTKGKNTIVSVKQRLWGWNNDFIGCQVSFEPRKLTESVTAADATIQSVEPDLINSVFILFIFLNRGVA